MTAVVWGLAGRREGRGQNSDREPMIRAELFTNGETFVIALAGTPISGTGATADAAYADLLRASSAAGELTRSFQDLAREQRGDRMRRTVLRGMMIGLISFGLLGGALAGAAALAPRVAADMMVASVDSLARWVKAAPPGSERNLAVLLGVAPPTAHEPPKAR